MSIYMFVVNDPYYFISHRLAIALTLKKKGHDVHLVAPGTSPIEIAKAGFKYHQVQLSRKGVNPFSELKIIWRLVSLFRLVRPDLVHLVTIKPYLYGGLAARIARVPAVVSAVAGLGSLFSSSSLKERLLRCLLLPFYRLAFGHQNQTIIFQNSNDHELLLGWRVLDPRKIALIRGAGVHLDNYPVAPEPIGMPVVSFAARLLLDKGVAEFVEASRLLKARGVAARFWLIGDPDSGNTNSTTADQLKEWQQTGLVELFGFRTDIAKLFAQSNIVSLPSYYGEGLPKVLIEAAACGRAVVTTDHPGCRDAIEPNETGLLVPIKDSVALADALERLIDDVGLRHRMGKAGRELAERAFTIEQVIEQHMAIYEKLGYRA